MYISEKKKSVLTIQGILFAIFFMALISTRLIYMDSLTANMILALSGIVCLIYIIGAKEMKGRKVAISVLDGKWIMNARHYLVFLLIFLSFFATICIMLNGNQSFYDIMWIMCYIGVAALLYFGTINSKILAILFYGTCLCFMGFAIKGISARDILAIGSENNISVYIILILVCWILKRNATNARIPIVPAIIAGGIIAWTGNRGGLLSVCVFIFLAVLYNMLCIKKKRVRTVIGYMFIVLVVMVFFYSYVDSVFGRMVEKIHYYGSSSIRTTIWLEYITAICDNPIDFFFGATTKETGVWLRSYDGNLHNAFFNLHANYGLIVWGFVLAFVMKSIKLAMKKKNYVFAIVLVTAFTRSIFDWTAFPGPFDVIFFYALFYLLDNRIERKL